MEHESEEIVAQLNELESSSRDLLRACESAEHGVAELRARCAELLARVADVRLRLDQSVERSAHVWEQLLNIADACYREPDPPNPLRPVVARAFEALGYEVFGEPGSSAGDLDSIEVVAMQDGSDAPDGTIVSTLRIGLRSAVGSVERYPRVIMARGARPGTGGGT